MKNLENSNGPGIWWKSHLDERLPSLGHRNWIGVVDSAYPEQTAAGVEILPTGEDHIKVIETVLEAVGTSRHVRSIAYIDAELSHLEETLAPGIDAFRAQLDRVLEGSEVREKPHEAIIEMLGQAGREFHVLLLKSNLALPYTSLFLQLECGYWDAEAEETLRLVMNKQLTDPVMEGK
jgi:hypothetical protein